MMKRLFLLDGMALVYRAHFAFIQAPIRNSKGVNTSALYGFTNTLLGILEKEQPTHLGVAFDTSAPTARHIEYPPYKAQREAMPEELAAAIPHVKRLCRAFGIPVIEKDGFEADDLIGTITQLAENEGDFESFMVTPDKDFAQLVSPKCSMWKPGRKGNDHEIMGLPEILQHWEIEKPSQVIDILGLWGDASDNIPGLPGIGEKTSKKLIATYGSIENLIANAQDLKGKQKENVIEFAEQALLSKRLATIWRDVPLEVTWHDLEIAEPHHDDLKALLGEFELRTLTKRLYPEEKGTNSVVAAEAEETPTFIQNFQKIADVPHHYQLADSPEKRRQLFDELAQCQSFCFDTETTGLNRFEARLLGIAFSWKAHEAWYLPYDEKDVDSVAALRKVFSTDQEKIGHNLKYDLSILQQHGFQVLGPFFDTMLADSLVAPERRHTMDYLAETLLNYSPIKLLDLMKQVQAVGDDLFELAAAKSNQSFDMESIPLAELAEYSAEDADVTFQLSEKLRVLLKESGQEKVMTAIEAPLLPVLVTMEMEGVQLDTAALEDISVDLGQQIQQLAASIYTHAGRTFNIASPKQLGEILFDELFLADKAKKTKTGQYKTDEQTLSSLEGRHPIIAEILSWRESTKLKSTYIDALPQHIEGKTKRVHTTYHQLVAGTGRLASSDPNLQNIPVRSEAGKKIRQAFVPRSTGEFTLLSCDYSQIELRVMAAISGDATMIEAFKQGVDIHKVTAAKVYGVSSDEVNQDMRRTAKMVNFGIIYGISAFGLSQRLGIPRNEAASVIDAYFREYPAIKSFMEKTIGEARDNGYAVTLSGRRRSYPDLLSSNQNLRSNAERAAINMPIQGSAADMIKLAMIDIQSILDQGHYRTKMLLQVHDELVFDLALEEKAELVPKILHAMQHALELPNGVPIEVEFGCGNNWLEAH